MSGSVVLAERGMEKGNNGRGELAGEEGLGRARQGRAVCGRKDGVRSQETTAMPGSKNFASLIE